MIYCKKVVFYKHIFKKYIKKFGGLNLIPNFTLPISN